MERNDVLNPVEVLPVKARFIALDAEAGRLYVLEDSRDRVAVFGTQDHARTAQIRLPRKVESLVVNPIAQTLYALAAEGVTVIDLQTYKTTVARELEEAQDLKVDNAANRLYVWTGEGLVVLDGNGYQEIHRIDGLRRGHLAFDHERAQLYLVQAQSHELLVFSTTDYRLLHTIPMGVSKVPQMHGPIAVVVDSSLNRVYVVENEMSNRVLVLDGVKWEVIDSFESGLNSSLVEVRPSTHQVFLGSLWEFRLDVFNPSAPGKKTTRIACDVCPSQVLVDDRKSTAYLRFGVFVVVCRVRQSDRG